ncbi:right-handed parallel beta-helix repeat-containing protein [candidate division KSB1 bacterium]|nr:right-handed parallel beta-helix repeat-containing protein [candidate division KSB1 bacterium]
MGRYQFKNVFIFYVTLISAMFFLFHNENVLAMHFTSAVDTLLKETLPPIDQSPVIADLYISLYGNDLTGNGSLNKPFKTVHHALDVADSGFVIMLRGGKYLVNSEIRITKPCITLMSYPNELAIIEAPTNDENLANCIWFYPGSDGGKLKNLEIIGGHYYAVAFETKWQWGDPNDRSGVSNVLVEDCKIHDTGFDCIKIKVNCDHITIRRCEIFNSGKNYPPGTNPEDANAEGIDNVNGAYMLVQDCYVHDIITNGIYFKGGARYGIVERTKIENCGIGGIMVGFDTSPDYFDTTINPEYYENIYGVVRNCLIINTRFAGIGMYAAFHPKIYNNTLVNVAQIGHSALYFGIAFHDWVPEAKRPPCVNPVMINNLIFQPFDVPTPMVTVRYTADLGGLIGLKGNPSMDYNCYYIKGKTAWFQDGRPANRVEQCDLPRWRKHINGETHSFEADPMINRDFHLLETSPCIDNGRMHNYVTYDFNQQRRQNRFDIGADELNITTSVEFQHNIQNPIILGNYPNPFNSATIIQINLPQREWISLKIYNALGQIVETVIQKELSDGVHCFQWKAEKYPGGIYFYSVECGTFRVMRKMVLLR